MMTNHKLLQNQTYNLCQQLKHYGLWLKHLGPGHVLDMYKTYTSLTQVHIHQYSVS